MKIERKSDPHCLKKIKNRPQKREIHLASNLLKNQQTALMCPGKSKEFYTDEELKQITEKWLNDKASIDREMEGLYLPDIDRAYIPYLHNKNLQALFRHAVYLYHFGVKTGELIFYQGEQELVSQVYGRIKRDGYYDRSKEFEKRVRAHLGNAVKRQTYRKYKKS